MTRFSFLLFIFFFIGTTSWSQEVILSEAITLRNEVAYYLIGKIKERHLILRERPGKFIVNAYNPNMTIGWEREIELPKRRPEIVDIWDLEDRFYVLFVHRMKGDALLKIHKYDGGANLVDSTLVKNFGGQFTQPDFNILQSENRKILQIERLNSSENRELIVFNLESMEVLYETTFVAPRFNNSSNYNQLLVDNEGTSYYVLEKENRRSRKKTHHYQVYGHESYTNRLFNFKVNASGRLTYSVAFTVDNLNNNLVGAGYYSDKVFSRASGTFYLKVPLGDPKSAALDFAPFDQTLLSTVEGKNKRQKKFMTEIRVKDLITRKDGGVLIVGEKYKRLESRGGTGIQQNQAGNFRPFATDFYYDDIFIVAHYPSGNLHWTNFFYKRQYSKDDLGIFSSYYVMKTPSQLRFLFNDEIVQNTTVSTYNVLPDGAYDRQAILNANFQNIKLRFVNSKQVSATEVVVPSEFRNDLRLLKIVF